jgi:predicted methyltransferase
VQRQFDVRALATELARIERATGELYDYVDSPSTRTSGRCWPRTRS